MILFGILHLILNVLRDIIGILHHTLVLYISRYHGDYLAGLSSSSSLSCTTSSLCSTVVFVISVFVISVSAISAFVPPTSSEVVNQSVYL